MVTAKCRVCPAIGRRQIPQNPRSVCSKTNLVLKGHSLPDFAAFLSNLPAVGRPVHDMTDLKGRFDFTLSVLESHPETIVDLKIGLANWQSVFADLQDQLGLKLETQKTVVETLVIDSADKPSPNR
jgi:uncharacterized protein (TIGR03435 family)